MRVIKVEDCLLGATSMQEHPPFVGTVAHAYLPNYGAFGFAKFIIDQRTLTALAGGLRNIESAFDRKHTYKMLSDMVISGHVAAPFVLNMIRANLHADETEIVIEEVVTKIVPKMLRKFIPD